MAIVHLPGGRISGSFERRALRQGLARSGRTSSPRLIEFGRAVAASCAACARPIEFGAVWRGEEAFCSVECTLGDRPA